MALITIDAPLEITQDDGSTRRVTVDDIKGPAGPTGVAGDRGFQGDRGEKGDTGATGDTGTTGAPGPQGDKGDRGDTGDVGPEGPQGVQGDVGPAGPIGLPSRKSVIFTTGSLVNNAAETDDVTTDLADALYQVTTNHAARVRAYGTTADRTSDAARAIGVDPATPCQLDVVTTGAETINLAPVPTLVNLDGTPASTIYFAVQNRSGGTNTITVTLKVRQEE